MSDLVILELKSVDSLQPIHEAQLLTYLKLTGLRVGLLINFNVRVLKEGIKRPNHIDPECEEFFSLSVSPDRLKGKFLCALRASVVKK